MVLLPEDYQDAVRAKSHKSAYEYRKHTLYLTSSRDGTVKTWNALSQKVDKTIKVSDSWVTAIHFMTFSRRLVAATANRMISFYDLNSTNYYIPVSRIENLVGVPLCIEYYRWPKNNEEKLETLLVGDDLGICHMYNITSPDWHYCEYKRGSKDQNPCHKEDIQAKFKVTVEKEFEEI